MAGIFDVAPTSGGGEQAFSPATPTNNQAATTVALGGVSQTLNAVAPAIKAFQTSEAQTKANSIIGGYSQRLLKLADARAAGMSEEEYRRNVRLTTSQALSNNPGSSDDLLAAAKTFANTHGLGKGGFEQTEGEKEVNARRNEAFKSGYVNPKDNQAKQEAQVDAYWESKAAVARITAGKVIGGEAARVEIGRIRLSEGNKFSLDLDSIRRSVSVGEMTQQDGIDALNRRWYEVQTVINGAANGFESEFVSQTLDPFKEMYEATLGVVDGTTTNKLAESRVRAAELDIKQNMALNHKLMVAKTILKETGVASNALLEIVEEETADMIAGMAAKRTDGSSLFTAGVTKKVPDITDPGNFKASETAYTATLSNMDAILRNGGTPEQLEYVTNNLDNIMRSIDAYAGAVENTTDYNKVTDFLANVGVGRYISKHGLPPGHADQARAILGSNYEAVLMPMIKKKWEDSTAWIKSENKSNLGIDPTQSQDREEFKISDVINVSYSGGGVRFSSPTQEPRFVRAAADLNRELAPVVNKLTRMGAHMEEHLNYKKTFEENFGVMFGDEAFGINSGSGDDSLGGGTSPGK